ncbi:hypothetical protein LMH87_010368 [Akanthomyces muscarius]|uniref:Uncharacterized protein n=1 Tax=Akanthomyces muscarius TaxID=2231603 RepID=A0A9W8QDV4_AKAMU|nr:hypothetical protein LMH87_010368 [Akanthomyces muscarius]KAJ4153902.1 hypothetical protein LMH87_010368 [Akanthomyces muscarius]
MHPCGDLRINDKDHVGRSSQLSSSSAFRSRVSPHREGADRRSSAHSHHRVPSNNMCTGSVSRVGSPSQAQA